jgi:hypothetical protein
MKTDSLPLGTGSTADDIYMTTIWREVLFVCQVILVVFSMNFCVIEINCLLLLHPSCNLLWRDVSFLLFVKFPRRHLLLDAICIRSAHKNVQNLY